MRIQANSLLLFIGDSITDCGRRRPVGQGARDGALGDGYVSLVDAALTAAYPDYGLQVLNTGVAGNTVRDLRARWQTDALDLKPDWLTIFIGINDVWQQFGLWGRRSFSLESYTQTLDGLIQSIRPGLQGLVLMTPYILEPNHQEAMRALMDQYGAAVRQLAARHEALLVDTQAAFDHALHWLHPTQMSLDRVHVNLSGHMILARAWLRCVGCDWGRTASL